MLSTPLVASSSLHLTICFTVLCDFTIFMCLHSFCDSTNPSPLPPLPRVNTHYISCTSRRCSVYQITCKFSITCCCSVGVVSTVTLFTEATVPNVSRSNNCSRSNRRRLRGGRQWAGHLWASRLRRWRIQLVSMCVWTKHS